MGSEPTWSSTVETADDFAQQMSQIQDKAKATLEHAVDEMVWYYDHRRSPTPIYKVGAKVWLNAQNYMTTHPTKKLDHKWLGPFVIEKVISPTTINSTCHPMNEEPTQLSLSPTSAPTTQTPFWNVHLTHTPIWSLLMEAKSMKLSQS